MAEPTRTFDSTYVAHFNVDDPRYIGNENPIVDISNPDFDSTRVAFATFIGIGQMSGETIPDTFECDIAFYESTGRVIQALTRTIAVPIDETLRPIVDRWKARYLGGYTDQDDNDLKTALLNSQQAFDLAI